MPTIICDYEITTSNEPMSDYHGTATTDMPLFDCKPYEKLPQESQQDAELKRVKGRLAETIELFFMGLNAGECFHAGTLHQFVSRRVGKFQSPESATRVMRAMRQAGQINYELVNRGQSLYKKL